MHLVSRVSNGYIYIVIFFIIILLRSENVCTFVSQVSNGYTLSFFLLLLFFY